MDKQSTPDFAAISSEDSCPCSQDKPRLEESFSSRKLFYLARVLAQSQGQRVSKPPAALAAKALSFRGSGRDCSHTEQPADGAETAGPMGAVRWAERWPECRPALKVAEVSRAADPPSQAQHLQCSAPAYARPQRSGARLQKRGILWLSSSLAYLSVSVSK
ncbi:hypothetical protein WJX74_010022 [Apatococcus lobatus]|uniref:Uncharacterized protein n=1 Tax=Apatococcus lobatus TaxID=904363 RepID=A0AAW1SHM4_9CHLO